MIIEIYVDGSCSHYNEHGAKRTHSIMGCGIAVLLPGKDGPISHAVNLGKGGSNVAEILAIEEGLKLLKNDKRIAPFFKPSKSDVIIHSDSAYAVSQLSKATKPLTISSKAVAHVRNQRATRIKELMAEFKSVNFDLIPRCSNSHAVLVDSMAKEAAKTKQK
jgi:ribonuclease HI